MAEIFILILITQAVDDNKWYHLWAKIFGKWRNKSEENNFSTACLKDWMNLHTVQFKWDDLIEKEIFYIKC